MQDKTLVCKDCGAEFSFTVRDQRFYAEKGFENEPSRCRDCRTTRKNWRAETQRETFEAVCARCGGVATLPFRPRADKPVYCRSCYSAVAATAAR